jgi:hypothetical protein
MVLEVGSLGQTGATAAEQFGKTHTYILPTPSQKRSSGYDEQEGVESCQVQGGMRGYDQQVPRAKERGIMGRVSCGYMLKGIAAGAFMHVLLLKSGQGIQ